MSIFDSNDTQVTNPEGQPQEKQNQSSFLDVLAQAKGEQFRDPEVLAKSKLEADLHIEKLKAQLKEQEYLENLKKELELKAKETVTPSKVNDGTDPNVQTAPKDVDLDSLIEKKLAQRSQEEKAAANRAMVDQAMVAQYGTEAKTVFIKKAQELGMAPERLAEIAQENPNIFFKLVDVNSKSGVDTPTYIKSQVNSVAQVERGTGERNFAYYENLRKQNPSIVRDPNYYKEVEAAALQYHKQGKNFYK